MLFGHLHQIQTVGWAEPFKILTSCFFNRDYNKRWLPRQALTDAKATFSPGPPPMKPEQGDDDPSHDPALSDKTISFCWMPTQVCWHLPFPVLSLTALLFIYIIPVTLWLIIPLWFAYLCPEFRTDVHTVNRNKLAKHGPDGMRGWMWNFLRSNDSQRDNAYFLTLHLLSPS